LESFLVDKRVEISNLDLVKDLKKVDDFIEITSPAVIILTSEKSDTTSRVFLIPHVFWIRFPFFVNSLLLLGGRLLKKN